jgi:allantoinase
MSVPDLIIRGRKVVSADAIGPRSIHISDGRITSVRPFTDVTSQCEVIEANEPSVVMPGLVDTHVHINSPGRTDWEGFQTATRAAAAGGITTLVDMPLNSIPPTTTLSGFNSKLETASGKCHVDVAFWGGVVPGNTAELKGMLARGVVGFKCFLVPSGVDEFPGVSEDDLREAMPELTRLNALLIVHAELPGPIDRAATSSKDRPSDYQTFLASRPRAAENDAVELMIQLSREFGTRVHIVHLSSAEAVPLLREAQSAGVKITAETCPHYLHLCAEEINDGATEFKCCPPIRERANQESLWEGLAEGTISMVVSDHSPCPESMKLLASGDFLAAWGGIASLQLRLPIVWTEIIARGLSLHQLTRWLCAAPAELVGLAGHKGVIAEGADADLVIWNPDQELRVDPNNIQHRHKLTPYQGEILKGVVQKTFLRGRKIYDEGSLESQPVGQLLMSDML